jgi:alpha-L-rhamnosidase
MPADSPTANVRVSAVRAELRHDTNVVAVPNPRLSWKTMSAPADWLQGSAELSDGTSSVVIPGRDSAYVAWPFAPLTPGEQRQVTVRVTGVDGIQSAWSEPTTVTGGFLADGTWEAAMVGLANPDHPAQPVLVRGSFVVDGEVASATLFATAHGVYQAQINGTDVDDQILKPGWTVYPSRLVHEVTDVTHLISAGENAIGVSLGGGWYGEKFGFRDQAARVYGDDLAVAVQLDINYADGRRLRVVSDGSWRATGEGPITASSMYDGESFDATRAIGGWSTTAFDATVWSPVRVDGPFPTPEPRSTPAVRATEEVAAQAVIISPSGKTIVDFGQNLVGRLRIRVRGQRGHVVTLRHAEVLEHGELGVRPLRNAKATDTYTLAGTGEEVWEPAFTFHGFRYAEIGNWPGPFDRAAVTAVFIHSDMERIGRFDSSHALVNTLHENVIRSMRGNFLSIPTDCPQRDERLGWTGDIQVFSPTASFLYDVNGFLTGWLKDLAIEQSAKGGIVPFIVPDVLGAFSAPAAAWGDAATVVPWVLYERFGDISVLAAQYESMKAWVEALLPIAGDRHLWEGKFQFGDWLDPDAPDDHPADAKSDPDIVASAYLYRSTDILARTAALLGHDVDSQHYAATAAVIRSAFLREYVTESGRMMSDAQTSYGLAIMFGLNRGDDERQRMGDRLAELVRANGYRIGTGFVGTPLIADALCLTGHSLVAGRLVTETQCPSWLYPVTMGATTVWERWNSMLEDGSINVGEMTSFNHYALGAIADWLHRSLAGLAPAAPGYRVIRIQPLPLPEFDHASASHETHYGLASAGWKRSDGTITISATIPPNTTAEVVLPDGSAVFTVGSGSHRWVVVAAAAGPSLGEVSLASSLADIIDDPEAYTVVSTCIAEADPGAAKVFRTHTKWTKGRQLAEAMFFVPVEAKANIVTSLAELSAARASAR